VDSQAKQQSSRNPLLSWGYEIDAAVMRRRELILYERKQRTHSQTSVVLALTMMKIST
jgi:hypothetical protein